MTATAPIQVCPECGKPEPFQHGPGYCEDPAHHTDAHAMVEVVPAEQLQGAVEAVRAHRERWVKSNGERADNMRPADRELWVAVLGPEAGGR